MRYAFLLLCVSLAFSADCGSCDAVDDLNEGMKKEDNYGESLPTSF